MILTNLRNCIKIEGWFRRNRLKVLIFARLIGCKCQMGTAGKAVSLQKGHER